ncbi:hypothetical protein EDD16DRAFT_1624623, partial [Pisolithus croceorrhizus]
ETWFAFSCTYCNMILTRTMAYAVSSLVVLLTLPVRWLSPFKAVSRLISWTARMGSRNTQLGVFFISHCWMSSYLTNPKSTISHHTCLRNWRRRPSSFVCLHGLSVLLSQVSFVLLNTSYVIPYQHLIFR